MEKEEYLKLIELLKENIEEYDISIEVEPQIEEYLNCDGSGIRRKKYIRTITIIDKEPIIERVESIKIVSDNLSLKDYEKNIK